MPEMASIEIATAAMPLAMGPSGGSVHTYYSRKPAQSWSVNACERWRDALETKIFGRRRTLAALASGGAGCWRKQLFCAAGRAVPDNRLACLGGRCRVDRPGPVRPDALAFDVPGRAAAGFCLGQAAGKVRG